MLVADHANNPPVGNSLGEVFLRERAILRNVTADTIHQIAFKRFHALFPGEERPSLPQLKAFVVHLRERGIKPITVNTYITAMNAYCRWLFENQHAAERIRLGKLKVEQRVIAVLDDAQLQRLLRYKPKYYREQRTHLAVLLALDTGIRQGELLTLRRDDIDMENCLLKVFGKGQKERLVPFSQPLRVRLYRFMQLQQRRHIAGGFLTAGTKGEPWEARNATTSLHRLLHKAGVPRCGWHRLRHTFATYYLRGGGDLMRLSLSLGHAKVTTTQMYLHLQTKDLREMHATVSIFSRIT